MKSVSGILLSLSILFLFWSCGDEGNKNPKPEPDKGYSQYGTPFDKVPDSEDIVMYEINLRAFSSGGDLQGVIDRLDEIQELGVNVIWLMPIHPIGAIKSVNSPYSVQDYKAVGTEYGTFADLRTLTNEAHHRGISVIMDWVANHTAWDHPWMVNKAWYTQDGSGNVIHPPGTNWQDVADLNYLSQDMQNAMIDAMKYWVLEANIDGFRCDHADGVPYSFWKRAFDSLTVIENREYVLLAEGARGDHFAAGFDLNFGWNYYNKVKSVFDGQAASGLFATHTSEYDKIPVGKHQLRFTTNHDESAWDATPMTLFNGQSGALAASVATIFMGGVPLLYSSQEVGRISTVPFFSNSTINWNANPEMFQTYQDLMEFYNDSQVVRAGTATSFSNANVLCLKKIIGSDEVLIVINVRNNEIEFVIPEELRNSNWSDALTGESVILSDTLLLSEYDYLILNN